jgi:two-component system, OmpR family, phosphate regulon response regulator PhoB
LDGLIEAPAGDWVVCGPLWVSPTVRCEARLHGDRVAMSPSELLMLSRLVEADGAIVSRDELYGLSVGRRLRRGSRAVDIHMARIRKALGAAGRLLIGVPKRGYRLDTYELARLHSEPVS